MVKARAWLALVVISFGTLAATVSCGSDEVTGGPGVGGGLITGGTGGAAGKGGAVGRGGTGGGTGTVVAGGLGLPCLADIDCGDGLTCLVSNGTDLGTGGPANGLCTLSCTQDTDCASAETGAGCVSFDGVNGVCLESCVPGNPLDMNTKCQGRSDFLCADLAQTGNPPAPFCVPLCQFDAQCGTGAFCNPLSGLCEKTRRTGDPVGTPCDPSATTDRCLGFCLQTSATGVTPVTGACTEFCSAGTECFYTGAKPGGFCARIPQGSGLLDLGICESSCNCDSDCPFPGDVCQAWFANAGVLETDLASAGFCFPNATGATELTCGSAGTGNTPGSAGAGG